MFLPLALIVAAAFCANLGGVARSERILSPPLLLSEKQIDLKKSLTFYQTFGSRYYPFELNAFLPACPACLYNSAELAEATDKTRNELSRLTYTTTTCA
jgi:hypothetical protein